MTDIPAPTVPLDDDNRHRLCQMAIEIPLQDVIEAAVRAGWYEDEVLTAIISVADNFMLADRANPELDGLLKTCVANPIDSAKRKARRSGQVCRGIKRSRATQRPQGVSWRSAAGVRDSNQEKLVTFLQPPLFSAISQPAYKHRPHRQGHQGP
jgi:hypothetical protein